MALKRCPQPATHPGGSPGAEAAAGGSVCRADAADRHPGPAYLRSVYLGMTVAEIARIEGADRRRVWESIRRGLKKLARLLDTAQ